MGMTGHVRAAALVLATTLFGELLAWGVDSPPLATAAAVAEIAAAGAVFALLRPDAVFWRAVVPVALPLMLLAAWLASPWWPGGDPLSRQWSAPDLLAQALVRFGGGSALLLAAAAVGWRRGGLQFALDTWVLLGIVQLGIALALQQWTPELVWGAGKGDLTGRFTGTFLNANAAGCLYVVLAILALGRGLTIWQRRLAPPPLLLQVTVPVALLGGVGACAITGSRSATVIGFAGLVGLASWGRARGSNRLRRLPRALVVALPLAALAMTALAGEATFDRFTTLDADGIGRWRIWTFYARLVGAAPLGYGPEGLDDAALHGFRTIGEAQQLWFVHSAHDVVLSLLMTGGWPYLALMVWLAGALSWPVVRFGASRAEPLVAATMVALAAMVACASVDIVFDLPALSSLAAVLAGLMWGRGRRRAALDQPGSCARIAATGAAAGVPATSPVANR